MWVQADPTRLEQVAVNLLTNAAKYTQNEGHIRLTARREGDEIAIAVKDDGVGIPPEKLPQMFEMFAQGDRSLARSEGGLGIGLTLVKSLVELHGGSITATSEVRGQGMRVHRPVARHRAAGLQARREETGASVEGPELPHPRDRR